MDNNVGLILAKRAHLSPKLEALVDTASGRRLSYSELNTGCNRTARALALRGIGKGDRVAILTLNCPEFVETFFALAKLGAVVVPLNVRLVARELSYILNDSGALALVYGEEFRDTVATIHADGDEASCVTDWIQVVEHDGTTDPFALDYHALQTAESDAEPAIGGSEDDMLYIMYTSGTTGLPKGVVHTHNSAIWASLDIGLTSEMRFKDRYLLALPAYHVGALTPLTSNVHLGVTTVIMRSFDPRTTWQLIEQEAVTIMLAVPAMLTFMYQVPDRDSFDYSRMRWIMSGGAPVPVTSIEAFGALGIEIHEVYGLTECCGPGCLISPDDARDHAGSAGKPFFHGDARVVDADGNDTPPGEPGEIILRGRHIMKEYWNQPEASAETLRDGWLHTGDIATMDADGFVYIKDRLKDMLISGGENVYPAEIENTILAHPKVGEVAVIGQPSARWGEVPLAVVVASDPSATEDDILAFCIGKLARFKLPKAVAFVDQIPRNPTGKVLKQQLRKQFPGTASE